LYEAIGRFCAALRRLVHKLGAEAKYHESISWFFLLLIQQRRQSIAPGCWDHFRRHNADLINAAGPLLRRHYSEQLLDSSLARRTFVFPDRLADEA
jgi:hypothetical protein